MLSDPTAMVLSGDPSLEKTLTKDMRPKLARPGFVTLKACSCLENDCFRLVKAGRKVKVAAMTLFLTLGAKKTQFQVLGSQGVNNVRDEVFEDFRLQHR